MKQFQEFEYAYCTKARHNRPSVIRPVFPAYRVGELFHENRLGWPQGAQFTSGPRCHELTLFQADIGPGHVHDISRGPADFALIVETPVIVLAYRFGESIAWTDVPYSWHLQPEFGRAIPSLASSHEERSLLWITLVGTQDGIIYAQRGMTLSPEFTRALHQAIREQAMSTFDAKECTSAISSIYLRSLGTCDRLEMAKVRTMGNE
jgi:hypothetical protein